MASKEKRGVKTIKFRVDPVKVMADTNPTEEGHPVPLVAPLVTPITVQHHRRASLGFELERSDIQEMDLNSLRVYMLSLMTLE